LLLRGNIACVRRDHPGVIPQNALRIGKRVGITARHRHVRPLGDKFLRRRQANARRTAGNQRIFIC